MSGFRLGVFLLLALLSLPHAAQAFVRSRTSSGEQCLQWTTREIPWTMNERGHPTLGFERAHAAFERAFRTWEQVGCTDIAFRDTGPSSETRVGFREGDQPDNLVIFREEDCRDAAPKNAPCHDRGTCGNEFDCWSHGSSVIAVTTSTYFRSTGEVIDADIEMNAAWFDFTDVDGPPCGEGGGSNCVATDIQNTATHEIGHLLGLDHTSDRDSTMFASAPPGETSKRRLGESDREGVCAIYPAGQPTRHCAPLEDTEGPGCGCSGGEGGVGSLAILLAALAILRQGRRGSRPPTG